MITRTLDNAAMWEAFFARATDCASEAMNRWTHGDVSLTLDEMQEASLCEVGKVLKLSQDPTTLVMTGISGDYGGVLILSFDDNNAARLVSSLLRRPTQFNGQWSDLELSALSETGNILGSAYLNSMTAVTGCRLWPSPPAVVRDYAMSVIQQAIVSQAVYDDCVLLCHTRFECRGERVEWHLIFVPSTELLRLIHSVLSCDE